MNLSSQQIVPIIGMTFPSEEKAYEFYNSYATTNGFSIRKIHKKHRADGTLCSRCFVCTNETKKRRATKRTSCPARVQFTISREGIWNIQKVVLDHNHGPVDPDEFVPEIKPTFQAGQQLPMKTEERNPATTEQQTMKATDGEVVADGEGRRP